MNIFDQSMFILWIGFTSSLIITGGYGIIKRGFYFPSREFFVKRYEGSSAVIWGIMIAFIGMFFFFFQCRIILEENKFYIGIIGLLFGILFSVISQRLYKQNYK